MGPVGAWLDKCVPNHAKTVPGGIVGQNPRSKQLGVVSFWFYCVLFLFNKLRYILYILLKTVGGFYGVLDWSSLQSTLDKCYTYKR